MVSLRTVYQVLHDLAELDEIQILDLGTGATRFDPNVEPHHHLVCSACGAVRDVPVPDVEPGRPDSADFSLTTGFTVDRVEVVFRGTCARCMS
jgi:Fe2+ or Zn2+ uptake regulation protein